MAALTAKRSISYIRAVLTFLLLLLAAYSYKTIPEGSLFYVYTYIVVLIASNVALIMTPGEKYEGMSLHYVIFIVDILFITLGMYWLSSMDFHFFIIMFLTIFMCALSKSMGLSVAIAIVADVVYLYMKYSTIGGFDILMQQKVLLNLPFLFVVAVHSSYLAEQAADEEYQKKKLERSKKDLSDRIRAKDGEMENASRFSDDVLDAMPAGIIVLDQRGIIRNFNTKAETVFNTKRSKTVNFLYREVKILGDVITVISELITKRSPVTGREINAMIDNEPKKLKVSAVFVANREGMAEGVLCTIEIAGA